MVIVVSSFPRPQARSVCLGQDFLLCGHHAHSGSLEAYLSLPILESTAGPLSENRKPRERRGWEGSWSNHLVSPAQVQSKQRSCHVKSGRAPVYRGRLHWTLPIKKKVHTSSVKSMFDLQVFFTEKHNSKDDVENGKWTLGNRLLPFLPDHLTSFPRDFPRRSKQHWTD